MIIFVFGVIELNLQTWQYSLYTMWSCSGLTEVIFGRLVMTLCYCQAEVSFHWLMIRTINIVNGFVTMQTGIDFVRVFYLEQDPVSPWWNSNLTKQQIWKGGKFYLSGFFTVSIKEARLLIPCDLYHSCCFQHYTWMLVWMWVILHNIHRRFAPFWPLATVDLYWSVAAINVRIAA